MVSSASPLQRLARTPLNHFRLYGMAAVLRLLKYLADSGDDLQELFASFPFLAEYNNRLADLGLNGVSFSSAEAAWETALRAWESGQPALPLTDLGAAAGLDYADLALLMACGLVEEDPRFAGLFDSIHAALTSQDLSAARAASGDAGAPGAPLHPRPTLNLFNRLWPESAGPALRRMQSCGLLELLNPEAPRLEWSFAVALPVWDALRGEVPSGPFVFLPPERLSALTSLVLPEELRQPAARAAGLLAAGQIQAVVVRGPLHNGRAALLGALARETGRGLLLPSGEAVSVPYRDAGANPSAPGAPSPEGPGGSQPLSWPAPLVSLSLPHYWGALATLLRAMPLYRFELAPGETAEVPSPAAYAGPLGVVAGRSGGLSGPAVEQAITLTLALPGPQERRRLWQLSLDGCGAGIAPAELDALAGNMRLASGNIRRAARLAQAAAALEGHTAVTAADARAARRALNHQALEILAQRLETAGDWSSLVSHPETLAELHALEGRCRHRELLPAAAGPGVRSQLNAGVRALFSGPSGTGKSLAARVLAASLGMDLYRLDLSAVVNKYIGETEKNLAQVFACAEELDVILLLDEGDALLTQRTAVATSNDRYANLETNYLLQRIESFEGILIVTSNASERIDPAFQRRMDVVVDFRAPDPAERYGIWYLHLPAENRIDPQFLREVASRCNLTGGQIRNAALHATLLALNDGGMVTSEFLLSAVQREYRKGGLLCPLRAAPLSGQGEG